MKNLNKSNNSLLIGLLVTFIGAIYLLKNLNVNVPHWLFSWHFFLIIIGIGMLIKHNFKNYGGAIVILIGAYYTLEDIMNVNFNFSSYFWPLALVALGLFLIFKPKNNNSAACKEKWESWKSKRGNRNLTQETETDGIKSDFNSNEFLSCVNIFGASQQSTYNKNLKGGEFVAIFGGSEINLTQADFENNINIEVVAVFGGVQLILPSNWEIQNEITTIFGGLEDKRRIHTSLNGEPKKVLILKGAIVFGGIEVKN
ncbi:MAG: cell wall-active antibiotics response protein [Sphingobacteriaceae bacterium]|nr:cell wall-active antibiotics response protein [Sphingobacteriaceae bacterium]